jgi:hypothetical protein
MPKISAWMLVSFLALVVAGARPAGCAAADVLEKPVIYLYPGVETDVHVTLEVNGAVFQTEPAYNNGWFVHVTRKGTINNERDYLYYEAVLDKPLVFVSGSWVVKRENLQAWFDDHLADLGLNALEIHDFKAYWLNRLTQGAYYEIALVSRDFLDENAKLVIVPVPDTVIRCLLYFIPLQETRKYVPPDVRAPRRRGFTVVEWGGVLAEENADRVR